MPRKLLLSLRLGMITLGAATLFAASAAGAEQQAPTPAPLEATADAAVESPSVVVIEGTMELEFDKVWSNHASARFQDAFVTVEPEVTISITDTFRLFTGLVLEPVLDPVQGERRLFGDEGLYVKDLYAEAEFGPALLQIGKITPTFGWANDEAPGIFGSDFASDYELTEKLGINGAWTLSEAPGKDGESAHVQTLHAAVFTADNSILSDSVFTSRGRTSTADGGVGNTDLPQSFAAAYTNEIRDGEDEIAGPSYQLAVRRLAPGQGDQRAEYALLASFEDRIAVGPDAAIVPLFEAAYLAHSEGSEKNGLEATVGAELRSGAWRLSSTYAIREIINDSRNSDQIATLDIGRYFEGSVFGPFRADAGIAYAYRDGEDQYWMGFRLQKDFAWQN